MGFCGFNLVISSNCYFIVLSWYNFFSTHIRSKLIDVENSSSITQTKNRNKDKIWNAETLWISQLLLRVLFFPFSLVKFRSHEKALKCNDDNFRLLSSHYHQIIRKAIISLSPLGFRCVSYLPACFAVMPVHQENVIMSVSTCVHKTTGEIYSIVNIHRTPSPWPAFLALFPGPLPVAVAFTEVSHATSFGNRVDNSRGSYSLCKGRFLRSSCNEQGTQIKISRRLKTKIILSLWLFHSENKIKSISFYNYRRISQLIRQSQKPDGDVKVHGNPFICRRAPSSIQTKRNKLRVQLSSLNKLLACVLLQEGGLSISVLNIQLVVCSKW